LQLPPHELSGEPETVAAATLGVVPPVPLRLGDHGGSPAAVETLALKWLSIWNRGSGTRRVRNSAAAAGDRRGSVATMKRVMLDRASAIHFANRTLIWISIIDRDPNISMKHPMSHPAFPD
jgi:hypothetical protein